MKRTLGFRLMTSRQQAAPMLWRWRRAALKRASRYSVGLLLTFLLAPWLAFGQQTGPQPGATGPLGGPSAYTLLRGDELFWLHLPAAGEEPAPGVSFNTSQVGIGYNTFLNQETFALISQADYVNDFNWGTESQQFFTASGRPLQPDKDQVVVGQRSGASAILLRFFTFPGHQERQYTLPNAQLATRVPASNALGSDFMDVAVGDLDRLPDSAGSYHDEVVVVWAVPEHNNTAYLIPNVAVLDYTSPTADPQNPLAVTSVPATANPILFSINTNGWHGSSYTNDGAGNRSLQPVTQFQFETGKTRMGGSVDLAAANIDGDAGNKDELLLGWASDTQVFLDQYQADSETQNRVKRRPRSFNA